jgi:hypothetical protein
MQRWTEEALRSQWPDWSYEETIKAKLLFLEFIGKGFAKREDPEGRRLAEHLESYGGERQATLFAGDEMVSGPQAALGNSVLTDAPLVFPVVLAAIEQLNKGGKELLSSLIVGLEASYRMGDHPSGELVGALFGAAHAFELDAEGWQVLLGAVAGQTVREVPRAALKRGMLAHNIVLAAGLARDEWSRETVESIELPQEWAEALEHTADKPGLNHFLMTLDVNADQIVMDFRERVLGKLPDSHVEYYVDAVMGLEDICCIPLFFRK